MPGKVLRGPQVPPLILSADAGGAKFTLSEATSFSFLSFSSLGP